MRHGWTRFGRGWEAFWFAPASALNLAVARVLVSGTALWIVLSRDLPALSGVPPVFWSASDATFRWRYLLFPGHESLERWLQGLAVAALLATLAGVGVRAAGFVAGLILLHLTPLESFQWSASAFTLSLPILGLFAVAASPSGDALSLLPRAARASGYRWPVQLIRVLVCLSYFFSGYSKLIETGPSWAAATHLQAWILGFAQREHPVYTSLPLWVAGQPWLCAVMGAAALGMELAFPAVLISTWARRAFMWLALAMHLGITLVLNITILYWPLLFVFVDWDGVAARAARRR